MSGTITDPGVYDIPTESYLADPVDPVSLSSSELRTILFDSPLDYRDLLERRAEEAASGEASDDSSRAQQLGTVAHLLNLGVGAQIAVIEEENLRTNRAKAAWADAIKAGETPILRRDYDRAVGMREQLLRDPAARRLLVPGEGLFERTIVWDDPATGVMCRGMLDFLRHVDSQGDRVVVDYKTTKSLRRYSLERSIYDYGYYFQGAHYRAGIERLVDLGILDGHERVRVILLFQRTTRPYPVVAVPLETGALYRGDRQRRKAIDRYLDCVDRDEWLGPTGGEFLELGIPGWAEHEIDTSDLSTRADRAELAEEIF